MLYKFFAKPVLFRLDPERAHHLAAALVDTPLRDRKSNV